VILFVNIHTEKRLTYSILHRASRTCVFKEALNYLFCQGMVEDHERKPAFVGLRRQERARGSVVVKALCYKSEGRGFDTR
jgi:hypothetical protein